MGSEWEEYTKPYAPLVVGKKEETVVYEATAFPSIYDLRWVQGGKVISETHIEEEVILEAKVKGVPVNSGVQFTIYEKKQKNEKAIVYNASENVDVNNKVSLKWKVIYKISNRNQNDPEYYTPVYYFKGEVFPAMVHNYSGDLKIWSKINMQLKEENGTIIKDQGYLLCTTKAVKSESVTDGKGFVLEEKLEVGPYYVLLKPVENTSGPKS